jgi:SAM-dependent methyltransferase
MTQLATRLKTVFSNARKHEFTIGLLTTFSALRYYRRWFSSFLFQGREYRYFCHRYQATWRNERAVEIPIVWDIIKQSEGKTILEIGNVLSHYFTISHDVVDKYEKAKGVINQDVVDFHTGKKYDLVISISTLEHVGWDEEPRESTKALRALQHIKEALNPQGKIVVTFPIGYNSELDVLLKRGLLEFTNQYYLKRVSRDNQWVEATWEDVWNTEYDHPYPMANGLVIGVWESRSD